jgi:hypothetical protein
MLRPTLGRGRKRNSGAVRTYESRNADNNNNNTSIQVCLAAAAIWRMCVTVAWGVPSGLDCRRVILHGEQYHAP